MTASSELRRLVPTGQSFSAIHTHYLLYSFSQRRHKSPPRFPIDRLTTSPLVSKERLGYHLRYDCRPLERGRICAEALLKQIFPFLWDEPHPKAVKISMPIFYIGSSPKTTSLILRALPCAFETPFQGRRQSLKDNKCSIELQDLKIDRIIRTLKREKPLNCGGGMSSMRHG